ncbi:MAG: isomerizing glutamine--fructose-6-phosphate transaminase, partial [Planctomycetota bacterium]|nr:isomerizing glutamine--fructose-6-phosphate transaminase [Planctomycetota bacterium]
MPILLVGHKRLEYRGYDSAGVATLDAGGLNVARTVGRVHDLVPKVSDGSRFSGTLGIAHTRWATHGGVTEDNAHPQRSDQSEGGVVTIVHNGIIENHATIKKWLEGKGHEFRSETDTEVLAHLIGEFYEGDLEQAVQAALKEVTGAYAIAAISAREPDCLVVARKGSPLIVGIGSDEFVVASDSSAIVAHTRQAFTLDDYTVARITPGDIRTTTLENVVVTPQVQELELDLGQIELGGYDHYMIKEIFEQPEALRRCTQGRLDLRDGRVVLGGISEFVRELSTASRFVFVGQGTALHACMVGKYLLEKIANIPATVEFASEFRYRNPIVEPGTVVVAISQSGETADTLAALEEAKQKGGLTLG